jgi:hypothetical protein
MLVNTLEEMFVVSGSALKFHRVRYQFQEGRLPGTLFCWKLSHPQGYSLAGRIR